MKHLSQFILCYQEVDCGIACPRSRTGPVAPSSHPLREEVLGLVERPEAEPEDDEYQAEGGPPRVSDETICRELSPLFDLVQLREIRFDSGEVENVLPNPLAWSALWRRK